MDQKNHNTEITISQEYPPEYIYKKCVEKWGVDYVKDNIAFTYGDTIFFAKGSDRLPEDLFVHEMTHTKQHREYPGGRDAWWDRYLIDDQFRLSQELIAYRNQYRWVVQNMKSPAKRFEYLMYMAQALSGKMYGNIISKLEAIQEIRKGV